MTQILPRLFVEMTLAVLAASARSALTRRLWLSYGRKALLCGCRREQEKMRR